MYLGVRIPLGEPERIGVLAYYADDILFTSPTALRVVPESGGVVRGKEALRAYWSKALERNGDRFTLLGVFSGVDTVALHYLNQVGGTVSRS